MRWVFLLMTACESTLSNTLLDASFSGGGSATGGGTVAAGGMAVATSVEGWVLDETTDAGLAGATVEIGVHSVRTRSGGAFGELSASPGLQPVQVSYPNYFEATYNVQLQPGLNQVELRLSRDCTKLRCPSRYYCGIVWCRASEGAAFISGEVTDFCTGRPMQARVKLLDPTGNVSLCADAQGRFRIDGREGGEDVTLSVSATGYEKYEFLLNLKAGMNQTAVSLSRPCSAPAPAPSCPP